MSHPTERRPIVLVDPSRHRRLFLEHAFECLGYSSVSTACGVEALQFVRAHEPRLLVAHVAVRCGSEPLTQATESVSSISGTTRILWFCERSTGPLRMSAPYDPSRTFLLCGDNPAAVARAVQELLSPDPQLSKHSSDLLLSLMLLDAELRELPDDCLW